MEGRVLLIENRDTNRKKLRQQFEQEGLEVSEATTGAEGIQAAVRLMPQVILVGINLPDIPGVDVAKRLREINRTKHIFLMMLGNEDNRQQRLIGLDIGANDFIDSPIDPELVALRVRNAINRRNKENSSDPITGMPAGRQVQDELLNLLRRQDDTWALMRFRILKLDPLREVHGLTEGDNFLRGIARILAEALASDDIEEDFLGYGGHEDFIVITQKDRAASLEAEVRTRFAQQIDAFYTPTDREHGDVDIEGKQLPLATLRVRSITQEDGPFYDIRSLGEAIAG